MIQFENLIKKGLSLKGWSGVVVADLGNVKGRLFHLTSNKEMVLYEDGHSVNEWVIVLHGEVIIKTPEAEAILTAGDSYVMPPETPHHLNVKKNAAVCLIIRDMKQAPAHDIPGTVIEKATTLPSV